MVEPSHVFGVVEPVTHEQPAGGVNVPRYGDANGEHDGCCHEPLVGELIDTTSDIVVGSAWVAHGEGHDSHHEREERNASRQDAHLPESPPNW